MLVPMIDDRPAPNPPVRGYETFSMVLAISTVPGTSLRALHAGHEIPSGHGAPTSLCATLFALALIQSRCDSTRGKGQVS